MRALLTPSGPRAAPTPTLVHYKIAENLRERAAAGSATTPTFRLS